MMKLGLIVVQSLLLGVILTGDFGWNRPGKFGLYVDDLLFIGGGFILLLGFGLSVAHTQRDFRLASVQIILLLVLPVVFLCKMFWPQPAYEGVTHEESAE